jgi:7,8-dihydropterin-6-yl-methyl-4-(beta-D-ribofuranosyl)aminobenzene 5'-phosphate synthase
VVVHPTLFRPNFTVDPVLRHHGTIRPDGPEEILAAGGRLFPVRDPLPLMPGLTTTGEVPRVTDFEEVGMDLMTLDEEGRLRADPMEDDLSLVASVRGKGLVVLTGCAHAGIVNVLLRARDLAAGERPLAGVLGGFHLVEASGERIARTVEALAAASPGRVAAGHCTGFPAQTALRKALGDRFEPLGTGRVYVF